MPNILRIIKISRPLYPIVASLIILVVLSAALELVAPILSKYIIDEVVNQIQNSDGNYNNLIFFITLSFLMSALSTLVTSLSDRLGDHFGGQMRKYLTEKYYLKVLSLSQSYFDSELSGKIVNQLNRGIQSIQEFLTTSTNFILPTILQTIFTIIVLAFYNLQTALLTSLLFPVYLSLSYYSTKRWGVEEVKKNKFEDTTRARIQEVISNIKVVKSFITEKSEYKLVEKNLGQINQIYARQSRTYHLFDFFRNMSLNVILLGINIIIFINAFRGLLTLGEVVLILQLLNQVRRPLFAMSYILTAIQQAESGTKEFFEVLNLPETENSEIQTTEYSIMKNPSIQFKNVSFRYSGSETVLKDVSFTLQPGQKTALVGHSGAGKSTIVNLILKFYLPEGGEILLNGLNYHQLTTNYVRQHISLVFQENELFSSTIRENVSYGQPNISQEEIINALKKANAYDFVIKLPQGIDSEIGERGVRLSGGQKQRIQIARAILKDSPILILDEATSSLDAKSEKEVQDGFENLMRDKMVIIIAHRFSTIQNVDKVIVLNQGEIIDSGNPRELSARPGIYSDLLRYQIEGNKKLLENFEIY